MAVPFSHTGEVLRAYVETDVGAFQPSATGHEHRPTFAGPGTQPAGIDGALQQARSDHHEIECINECRYHGGRLVERWTVHNNESLQSHSLPACRSQAHLGGSNHRSPRTLSRRFSQERHRENRTGDLHNRATLEPAPRKERHQITAKRKQPILRNAELLHMSAELQLGKG